MTFAARLDRLEARATPPAVPVATADVRRRDDPFCRRLERTGVVVWNEAHGRWTGHPDPEVRRWLRSYLEERLGRPNTYVKKPFVRSRV